jgi:hypothetical protein
VGGGAHGFDNLKGWEVVPPAEYLLMYQMSAHFVRAMDPFQEGKEGLIFRLFAVEKEVPIFPLKRQIEFEAGDEADGVGMGEGGHRLHVLHGIVVGDGYDPDPLLGHALHQFFQFPLPSLHIGVEVEVNARRLFHIISSWSKIKAAR